MNNRAKIWMLESIKKGYKRNIYRCMNNNIYLKKDVDKLLVFDFMDKTLKKVAKSDDKLNTLFDCIDGAITFFLS